MDIFEMWLTTHTCAAMSGQVRPFFFPNDAAKIKILGRSKERVGRELLEAFYIKELGDKCVSDTSILGRSKKRVGRELLEPFYIEELGDKCASDTSFALYSAESSFLHSFVY